MKFGVREIAEVVLRAKSKQRIGKRTFYRNDPVIYFDTLTTSSLEGAATTNYATGGRGNTRLLAWEGERTLSFSMTDALISPESFMILSGAGLIDAASTKAEGQDILYVHTTSRVQVTTANTIILPKVACWSHSGEMAEGYYNDGADIFVMVLDNGEITGEPCIPVDDTAVEVVQIRSGEASAFQRNQRTQIRRNDWKHMQNHPARLHVAVQEPLDQTQALHDLVGIGACAFPASCGILVALLAASVLLLPEPVGELLLQLDQIKPAKEFLDGRRAHAGLEAVLSELLALEDIFALTQNLLFAQIGFAWVNDNPALVVQDLLQVRRRDVKQHAYLARKTLVEPDM